MGIDNIFINVLNKMSTFFLILGLIEPSIDMTLLYRGIDVYF